MEEREVFLLCLKAVGAYEAGKMTAEKVEEYVNKVCPTCGSCSGMYTANSMNCMTEVLGMGLRGNVQFQLYILKESVLQNMQV